MTIEQLKQSNDIRNFKNELQFETDANLKLIKKDMEERPESYQDTAKEYMDLFFSEIKKRNID